MVPTQQQHRSSASSSSSLSASSYSFSVAQNQAMGGMGHDAWADVVLAGVDGSDAGTVLPMLL